MNKKIMCFALCSITNIITPCHNQTPLSLHHLNQDCLLTIINGEKNNTEKTKTMLHLREISSDFRKKIDLAYLAKFSLQSFFKKQDNVLYSSLFAKWVVENTFYAKEDYYYKPQESAPIAQAFGVPNNYEHYQKNKFCTLLGITNPYYHFFLTFTSVFLDRIPDHYEKRKIFDRSVEIFFYDKFFLQKRPKKQTFYSIINFFADNWSNQSKFTTIFQQYFSLLTVSEYLQNHTEIKEYNLSHTASTVLEKCLQYNQNELLHTFMLLFLPLNRSFNYLISIAERLLTNGNDVNHYYTQTLIDIIDILCENTFDNNQSFERESRIIQLMNVAEYCITTGCTQNNYHDIPFDRIFNLFLEYNSPRHLTEIGKLCLQKKAYFKYFFYIITHLILSETLDSYWTMDYEKVKDFLVENKKNMTTKEKVLIQEYFDTLYFCFDDSKTTTHKENIRFARELLQSAIHQSKYSENNVYREYVQNILSFLKEKHKTKG